jgi:hypothetical protein
MTEREDPNKEGHTREWQDRARVVLDAKKAAKTEASQKQSPLPEDESEDIDKRKETERRSKDDEPIY